MILWRNNLTETVTCPINSSIKLFFITDAVNGYFSRNVGKGKREFSHPKMVTYQHLENGRDVIEVTPSHSNVQLKEGQIIPFTVTIYHSDKEQFKQLVDIKLTKSITHPTKTPKPPKPPKTKNGKKKVTAYFLKQSDKGSGSERIDPPKIYPISKQRNPKQWNDKFGKGNEKSGAVFFQKGNQISAFVNLSHPTLLDTQNKAKGDPKNAAKRHSQAVGLIPWALYLLQESKEKDYLKKQENSEEKYELTDFMAMIADAIAFFGVDFLDSIRKKR